TRAEVATRIVRAVLEPPSSWLGQGATVSAIPEGTQLALAPVTVSAGIAQVDLTNEVLALNDRERQRLRLQLAASLRGVSGVVGVQLTVDQNTVAIPDWTSGSPDIVPQVDPRVLVGTDNGEFGYATRDGVEPIGTLSAAVLELDADAVALAPTRTLATVRNDEGVWAVRTGDAPAVLLDSRPGLIAPSIDGYQFVWSVPSRDGSIRATELNGTVHVVEAALPDGNRVVSLDLSRDDARVLIMLDGSGGPRLIYAAVIRDEGSGVPIRLGELRDLPINGERAINAAWVDEVRVASITASGNDADAMALVELHELGGRSRPLGLPPGATQIVGGNGGVDGIRVLGEGGVVFEPRGSGWQNTGLRASFLGTQQ
ncbi:MAG: LpqB family beta-propeller domain-containing protein, partial [Microcella sp.]|nr:LpqB family beta-propeller domain-containing protein [Microcella sp.]